MSFMYRTLLCALVFLVCSSTISGVGNGLVGAAADAFCLDFLSWYSLTRCLSHSQYSAARLEVKMYHHCSVAFILSHHFFSYSLPSTGYPSYEGSTSCFWGLPLPLPRDVDSIPGVRDDCDEPGLLCNIDDIGIPGTDPHDDLLDLGVSGISLG